MRMFDIETSMRVARIQNIQRVKYFDFGRQNKPRILRAIRRTNGKSERHKRKRLERDIGRSTFGNRSRLEKQ